jgi:hypothetical protein
MNEHSSTDLTDLPLYPSAEISLARLAANRANAYLTVCCHTR